MIQLNIIIAIGIKSCVRWFYIFNLKLLLGYATLIGITVGKYCH